MNLKRTQTLLVAVLCALVIQATAAEETQIQANWRPCGNELNNAQLATNLQVFVPLCPAVNGTDSRCIFHKGSTATMIIKFKATQSIPSLERVIVARVPATADTKVEVPYGPAVNPCANSTLKASDGTECTTENGVQADKSYTYISAFDVLPSFPTVHDIETRVILRQANEKHRKLRLYRKHPGPTVFCVVIPHIDVQD